MPAKEASSFSLERVSVRISFLDIWAVRAGSFRVASISFSLSRDFLMVEKLVSMPPSQRLFT